MRSHLPPLNRRRFLTLSGSAALGAGLAAPALSRGSPAVETFAGTAFGTGWRISIARGTAGADLLPAALAFLDRIDREMSPYRSDSDLSRLNAAAAGRCAVPETMLEVTRTALDLAAESDGAFDPSVGPLVARWGFGPIKGDGALDWTAFEVVSGAIHKNQPRATLDLCGIAKGHALDGLVHLLRAAGHRDFFIDLGGEVYAAGRHPSGRAWQVGVEDPRPGETGMADVVALEDLAVATSGDRENGYDLGGRRYSHIIAPRTGQPVAGGIASVSVIAPDAALADGWATALMAAGEAAGPELARRHGLSALFLLRAGDGLGRVVTGAFGAYLA